MSLFLYSKGERWHCPVVRESREPAGPRLGSREQYTSIKVRREVVRVVGKDHPRAGGCGHALPIVTKNFAFLNSAQFSKMCFTVCFCLFFVWSVCVCEWR